MVPSRVQKWSFRVDAIADAGQYEILDSHATEDHRECHGELGGEMGVLPARRRSPILRSEAR